MHTLDEIPAVLAQSEREGEIAGRMRADGARRYTRVAPSHFGPNRTAAWLRGYDRGRLPGPPVDPLIDFD